LLKYTNYYYSYPNKPNLLHTQRKAIKIQKYANKKIRRLAESLYAVSLGSLLLNNSTINSIIEYRNITTITP